MANALDTLNARITDLLAQISTLEAERSKQEAWRQRNVARRDDWGIDTPEGRASQADVVAAMNAINDIDKALKDLRAELASARASRDAINAAAAEAVAKGVDPDVAIAQAAADHERNEGIKRLLTYTGIGLLILLIIIAIIYYRKHRKG